VAIAREKRTNAIFINRFFKRGNFIKKALILFFHAAELQAIPIEKIKLNKKPKRNVFDSQAN
jgi:hypothetical protein